MPHWLPILAIVAALTGARFAPSSSTPWFAGWLAASVLLAATMAMLVDATLPASAALLHRPLLAGLAGGLAAWALGTALRRRHAALEIAASMPAMTLLAGGWSWLLLTESAPIASGLLLSLFAAALCGLFAIAGAAFAARVRHRTSPLLLGLAVVLLALSAVATVG